MFWFVLLDERSAHVKAVARRCPVQKSAGGYELFLYCERRGKTRHIAYATKCPENLVSKPGTVSKKIESPLHHGVWIYFRTLHRHINLIICYRPYSMKI